MTESARVPSCAERACVIRGFFACAEGNPEDPRRAVRFNRVTYRHGDSIYVEGAHACGIYILCSGRAFAFTRSPKGRRFLVATISPGEAFGLQCLLGEGHRTECAQAAMDCTACFIDYRDCHFLTEDPGTALALVRFQQRHLQSFQNRLSVLASGGVHERVLQTILHLGVGLGVQDADEGLVLCTDFTKAEISELAGVSREAGNTELLNLERAMLISFRNRRLELASMDELKRLLDQPSPSGPLRSSGGMSGRKGPPCGRTVL